jgi:hypothetical protein
MIAASVMMRLQSDSFITGQARLITKDATCPEALKGIR